MRLSKVGDGAGKLSMEGKRPWATLRGACHGMADAITLSRVTRVLTASTKKKEEEVAGVLFWAIEMGSIVTRATFAFLDLWRSGKDNGGGVRPEE